MSDTVPFDYDVIVIGSGFGGSVTAMRLSEKGYRVGVLEAGQRYRTEDLPKTSWDARRFVWAPGIGCYGIQRIHLLKDVVILAGAGVGGGSLNYANTLYQPPKPFYSDPQWAHITDWFDELDGHYAMARRMLGVTQYPHVTKADKIIQSVAEDMESVTPSCTRRSACSSASRARRSTTRSSAAPGRAARDAPSAAPA